MSCIRQAKLSEHHFAYCQHRLVFIGCHHIATRLKRISIPPRSLHGRDREKPETNHRRNPSQTLSVMDGVGALQEPGQLVSRKTTIGIPHDSRPNSERECHVIADYNHDSISLVSAQNIAINLDGCFEALYGRIGAASSYILCRRNIAATCNTATVYGIIYYYRTVSFRQHKTEMITASW